MSSRWRVFFILPVVGILSFPRSLSSQATPAAALSAGARIGTIIKDAISVALPDATKLIDAMFGRSDKTDKKTATPFVNKQASDAKQASDEKLSQVSEISTELSVVSQYLQQTVPAAQKVARLLSRLDNVSGSSMPAGIKADWDDVDKSLQKLNDIKVSDINKVDPGLRLRLLEVRGIYDANTSDVASSISNKDISGLRSQLRGIEDLLNSFVAIAAIKISSLETGLDLLSKPKGATPQGGSPDARLTYFANSLDDDLSAAKKMLTKPYKIQ